MSIRRHHVLNGKRPLSQSRSGRSAFGFEYTGSRGEIILANVAFGHTVPKRCTFLYKFRATNGTEMAELSIEQSKIIPNLENANKRLLVGIEQIRQAISLEISEFDVHQ
jgi:hypothetical protein